MIGDVVFERKYARTTLTVCEVENGFRFHVAGALGGTGHAESWGCSNKWRTINAGKNAQSKMESDIHKKQMFQDSFRH